LFPDLVELFPSALRPRESLLIGTHAVSLRRKGALHGWCSAEHLRVEHDKVSTHGDPFEPTATERTHPSSCFKRRCIGAAVSSKSADDPVVLASDPSLWAPNDSSDPELHALRTAKFGSAQPRPQP